MAKLKLKNSTYNLNNVVNREFEEFRDSSRSNEEDLDVDEVEEFFTLYDKIFYEIPKKGEINSHQYLINQSTSYSKTEAINEEIQELVSEITALREENLQLKLKINSNV